MEKKIVIDILGLKKHFYSGTSFAELLKGRLHGPCIEALTGVDLQVCQGEIVGVMGTNGAGKSTLLRLIAGLLIPNSGQVVVLGQNIQRVKAAFREHVSYVNCDERSFSWRLSSRENLEFFAALYAYHGRAIQTRVRELLHVTGLDAQSDRPVRELSTGMRQRLALARGFLGTPKIYLFDEPTRGVDPLTAREIRRLILAQARMNQATLLVATHDFADIHEMCQRVIVLQKGTITAQGSPEEAAKLIGLHEEEKRCSFA